PDDNDRGHVRVASSADQRAEMQVEIGAELQAAVGMRYRERALDVVRNRLGRGIRDIVDRQDDHVVTYADAAVLAAITEECRLSHLNLPTLRFDVMNVRMFAFTNRRDDLADVDTILDDRVADGHIFKRHLVSDRDVLP